MWSSVLFTLLLGNAAAQLDAGTPGTSSGTSSLGASRLCNRTFADANVTGIVSFNPDVAASTNNVSWAATVYQQPNNTTQLSLWFSAQGANYSDNFDLGYDACYFWVTGLSYNTFLRGQSDEGGCLQLLDEACVNDLTSLTNEYASELVGVPSPGPDSNLTTNSLPTVCTDMATLLTQNLPDSCTIFANETTGASFFGGPPSLGGALTGNQSLVERANCMINDSYSLMWTQYGSASGAEGAFAYELANYLVVPLITSFMPIADIERPITMGYTKSFMSCVRANQTRAGSVKLPAAPAPTPIDTSSDSSSNSSTPVPSQTTTSSADSSNNSSGLSGGAIAGIVIGVILGVALLAGLIIFVFFKKGVQEAMAKRKSRKRAAEMDGAGYGNLSSPMEMSNNVVSEMGGGVPRAELGDSKAAGTAEMPGTQPQESINKHNPAELYGP